jgi:transposase, IS30 family
MEGNARTWFTPKQRAELWERWKRGQCVADIARALERRNKSGVHRVLALHGGIAPLPRRRAPLSLRLEEREEISRGWRWSASLTLTSATRLRGPAPTSGAYFGRCQTQPSWLGYGGRTEMNREQFGAS